MSYKVKTIISSNATVLKDDVLQLPIGEFPRDYDDVAFLNNRVYSKIFGERRADSSNDQKLLSVVKITCGRKSIHRAYRRAANMTMDTVALTTNSQRLLFGSLSNADEVTITKGSKFLYFWDHPFYETRMSMRIGVISVALAILSIVLAVISIIVSLLK